MEAEPDMLNVAYIDEYPNLAEKVRLKRLAAEAIAPLVFRNLIVMPTPIKIT